MLTTAGKELVMLKDGVEVTEVTATSQGTYAVVEVELRPKKDKKSSATDTSPSLELWQEKFKHDSSTAEKFDYLWLKVSSPSAKNTPQEYLKGNELKVGWGLITKEMLNAICPNAGSNSELLNALNKYCPQYSIDTPLRIAHFLAQTSEETGCYKNIKFENLNYSAKVMRKTFGCKGGAKKYDAAIDDCTHGRLRDKLWTQESTYAHHPENLGNYVYGNRVDLGNGVESSGDGFKYRGRGIIQLTGKAAYTAFTTAHNTNNPNDHKDFAGNDLDLIATNITYAVESACWYWGSTYGAVNSVADKGSSDDDVTAVTKKVNGGVNNLDKRLENFHKIKQYFQQQGDEI